MFRGKCATNISFALAAFDASRQWPKRPRALNAIRTLSRPLPPAPLPVSELDRAESLANAGRLDEASHLTKEITRGSPLDWKGHLLLALIEQERGDLREAETALRRVVYLAPELPIGHVRLGMLRAADGLTAAALRSPFYSVRWEKGCGPRR